MKYKVQKEEYKKVISDPIEIDIPEIPRYYWHNGIRRAYCVVPEWTSWNREQYGKEEEIWQIKVVEVDPTDAVIKAYTIRVSEFTTILSRSNSNSNYRLVENYLFRPDEETRTREQFMADYTATLEKIGEHLSTFPTL